MTTSATPIKSTVAVASREAQEYINEIAMVRHLMGGTAAMRRAGVKHMPSWPNEDPESYRVRLGVSTLFPAYSRTITTLAGKPFSKPITYSDDMPANIEEWMETDCDMQGRNLDAFAASILESALAYGMCGVLVDFPKVEEGSILTKQQEKESGLRPYLIQVEPWSIIGWRSERINGVHTLTQLRMMEKATVEDGEYGEKSIDQVRVLTRGAWEVHRKNDMGDWELHESGATSIQVIPFVPVYGNRLGFMRARPPMMEMAHLNVKHWQSQSDQDNILHVARVPILTVTGVEDDTFSMTIGASAAVKLPMGASAGFVEHTGSSVGAGRQALEDLKEEMRQAGAELLVIAAGAITATQHASENSVGMCALQRIVANTEDALDTAMKLVANWINLPEGGKVTLFNDFGAATLADASAQLLVGMRQSGDLSKKTLLSEIKRRGILSADVDVDDEITAAAADGPELGTMGAPQPNGAAA